MASKLLHALVAAVTPLLVMTGAALAQGIREEVEIPSLTLSDDQMLAGATEGAPRVVLTGRLDLPRSEEALPLVVLLHGSGGPGGAQMPTWASFLNENGIATLSLDWFTARGHEEIFTRQSRVGELQPVYDLYRAVEIVADDPRIDGSRIAVMGFSRGGIGALHSAMTRFQERYGPERGRLVAHLPFYPPCNLVLERDTEVSDVPIRLFHGAADNWNPAPACRTYIDRLASAGANAAMTIYPDAHHVFDNAGTPAYFVVADAQTSRRCSRREADGALVDEMSGRRFSWEDACVETRPAMQFNLPAFEAARSEVLATLASVFADRR